MKCSFYFDLLNIFEDKAKKNNICVWRIMLKKKLG